MTALARAAVSVLGLAAVAGCGGAPAARPAAATTPAVLSSTVVVEGYRFPEITVAPGSVVTVTDADAEPHTLTAVNGSFDTGSFDATEPGTFTAPTEPGSYEITCRVHPSMRGRLTVTRT